MLCWKYQDKAAVQVLAPHHNIVALADRRDYFLERRFAFLSLETVGKMFHNIQTCVRLHATSAFA